MEHKYEIDNHFTSLDWMKVYADAIQDQNLNMNMTLKMAKENGAVDEGRSDAEWDEMASVARYISNLRESLGKF